MTQSQRDLLMGILLLIFAVLCYVLTYHFSGYELETVPHDVGPAFLPRILLAALFIQSAFLVFFSLRRLKIPYDSAKSQAVLQGRPLIMFGAFLLYVYLATLFGYIASTIIFMALSLYLLGVRNLWHLILIPPAIAFASYYLFQLLLDVYLPSGSLF